MSQIHHLLDGAIVLYKRERSKFWQARFKLADKKWHRFSTDEPQVAAAGNAAMKLYFDKQLRREHKLPQNTKKFDHVAKAVLDQMKDELDAGNGKSVYGSYTSAINGYLMPFFKNHHLDSFTPQLMGKFDDWRKQRMGKEPKASSITNHNSALNKIFDYAEQHGWITPAVRPTLKNKGDKGQARPAFTLAEYRTLVRKLPAWTKRASTDKSRMMRELLREYVLILANTGIRHGTEALSLKWKNVERWNDGKGEIYLRLSVNGKTGERSLIARDGTDAYFQRIQAKFPELKELTFDALLKKKLDVQVFRLADGSSTANLNQTFEQFLDDSGLKVGGGSETPRTLYSLRHTYAT